MKRKDIKKEIAAEYVEKKKLELYFQIMENIKDLDKGKKWLLLMTVAYEILETGMDTKLIVDKNIKGKKKMMELSRRYIEENLKRISKNVPIRKMISENKRLENIFKKDKMLGYGKDHKKAVLGLLDHSEGVLGVLAKPDGTKIYKEIAFLYDERYTFLEISDWIDSVKEEGKLYGFDIVEVIDKRGKEHIETEESHYRKPTTDIQ